MRVSGVDGMGALIQGGVSECDSLLVLFLSRASGVTGRVEDFSCAFA